MNTATGLESVEPELLQLTSSLQASPLQVFWKVRLPWALPHIFSGMKVAMSLSVIGAVVGEFVGSDKGLGYLILTASSNMNTAIVFGVMTVLSALGIVVFWAVCVAETLLCPGISHPRTGAAETGAGRYRVPVPSSVTVASASFVALEGNHERRAQRTDDSRLEQQPESTTRAAVGTARR